jgi:hypothetical protein
MSLLARKLWAATSFTTEMKIYAPELSGTYVWQVADPKSSKTSFAPSKSMNPPPNCCYGHPLGRYDSDGCYWTFCPNAGEDAIDKRSRGRYMKHPQAEDEKNLAIKEKVWGRLENFGSYKETEF